MAICFLSFLLLALVACTRGQTICDQQAAGNTASCFTYRTQCHFSLAINRCVSGAPSTCIEFLSDQTGCTGSAYGCTYSNATALCSKTPPACINLTTTQCSLRSDCRINGTSCSTGSTTCSAVATQTQCSSSGCFWDLYLQRCYKTLSEVTSVNPCSSWSVFPQPNQACGFHGCMLDSTGYICLDPGAGSGNLTRIDSTFDYQFVNPTVLPGTLTFEVEVWLQNQLRFYPAYWTYISIGGGNSGYSQKNGLMPSVCNDVASYNATQGPPFYTAVADPVGMSNYFNTYINTNNDFNFSLSNTTFGTVLRTILGPLNITKGSFVRSVRTDTTKNWVIYTVSIDLTFAVQQCSFLGVYQVKTTTGTYYTVPLSIVQRDYQNSYISASSVFYVSAATTGTISVGSTSTYAPVLYRSEISSVTKDCPAGQGLLDLEYTLEIQRVYDGRVVGPRTISDILFTSPQYNNTLKNCYNETVISLQRVGCYSSSCYTKFVTRTSCRPLASDGNAFNNCSRALSSDRIATMGGDLPFPALLDERHDLWINQYRCFANSTTANNFTGCTLANQSPLGLPDEFGSKLEIDVYPQQAVNVQFDVYAGTLPTPSLLSLTSLEVLSQTDGTYVNSTVPLYNSQLRWNGVLSFVVGMLSQQLRPIARLTMDIATQFSIAPLDVQGQPVPNGKILNFDDVFPYMTYVPKVAITLGLCTGCSLMPAVANLTAYDGFSIPVLTLRSLSPGNGYRITTAYQFDLPQPVITPSQNLLGHSFSLMSKKNTNTRGGTKRRLLQTGGSSSLGKSGGFDFSFVIDETQNPLPLPDAANGTLSSNITSVISQQMQLRVFVDQTSGLPSDSTADVVIAYIEQSMPPVLARSLGVDVNRITNFNVLSNSQQVLNHSPARRGLLSFMGDPSGYFVAFVVLPAPTGNTTALSDSTVNSPTLLASLSSELLSSGLLFNPVDSIKITNVLVQPNIWYIQAGQYQIQQDNSGNIMLMQILFPVAFFLLLTYFGCYKCRKMYWQEYEAVQAE